MAITKLNFWKGIPRVSKKVVPSNFREIVPKNQINSKKRESQ